MFKKIFMIFAVLLFLSFFVACSSSVSEGDIQTAIAQTASAPREGADNLGSSGDEANNAGQEATQEKASVADISPTETPKPIVSCPEDEVDNYLEELKGLLEEWDDTVDLAGSTSRMGLPSLIQDMQNMKRDARRLDRPECADYLQDLVIVSMESEINAFITFLGQESDTIVSRKIKNAADIRAMVDEEIIRFGNDALAAYLASNTSAQDLALKLEAAEPFLLPDGWQDTKFSKNNELIVSIPKDWTQSTLGENDEFTMFQSDDKSLKVVAGVLSEPDISLLESDGARLFALQTQLETSDFAFYLEHSAEVGVYALNKGYIVKFSRRYDEGDPIEEGIWVIVVTPDRDEIFIIVSTERDEFAEIDEIILGNILSSIRKSDSNS